MVQVPALLPGHPSRLIQDRSAANTVPLLLLPHPPRAQHGVAQAQIKVHQPGARQPLEPARRPQCAGCRCRSRVGRGQRTRRGPWLPRRTLLTGPQVEGDDGDSAYGDDL